MSAVDYEIEGDIAVIVVRNPPVNALSCAVRDGLAAAIDRAMRDEGAAGAVLLGADGMFVAGADLREMGGPLAAQGAKVSDLLAAIEGGGKPFVAAIAGPALGGGCELALACHARVSEPNATIGLPEVKLGLAPGAGGTVRLTRLIGPAAALPLATSGAPLSATQALDLGLVDAIVDDARRGGVESARHLCRAGAPAPLSTRTDKIADVPDSLFADFRAAGKRRWRGQAAPERIVDCVEAATRLPFDDALRFERSAFEALRDGPEHPALKHAFFAEREARRIPEIDTPGAAVGRAAILGPGRMGIGIAVALANAGIETVLMHDRAASLERGLEAIHKIYAAAKTQDAGQAERALALITMSTNYSVLADCDLAIETVTEDFDLKRALFARLDSALPPHAVIATNTSSLDIDALATATSRPAQVIGAHFFYPAQAMALLEIVRGDRTSPATIATMMAFGKTIGKAPVLAGNCDGFIGNRMLQYYTGQSEFLLEEGALPEQIDRVAEAFGLAMGPLAMRDLSGLDVGVRVRIKRRASLPPDERLSPIMERLFEAGRLGQKAGKGFYRYEGRARLPDPEAMSIIASVARELGVKQRSFSDDEIRDRLLHPLVNEGARILEESIALRAGDIDIVWLKGYGFPAHRGGPMFWGAHEGLSRVRDTALALAARNGRRWAPPALLNAMVERGADWRAAPDLIRSLKS